MTNQFAAIAAKAAQEGADQTKAVSGGGDYAPPAAGPCRLRFIGYVEMGKHKSSYLGVEKVVGKVKTFFEVSGPKHPPREHEGVKYPVIIEQEENYSLNEKARFFKLAGLLNWEGKAKHLAELLGNAYRGEIIHRKYAKKNEPKDDPTKWTGVAVELYNKKSATFTISPPRIEDAETGDWKMLAVDPAISPLRCFIWEYADMEQWKSIFIDGQYPERKDDKGVVTAPAKSKNVLQEMIRAALNFPGSPIYTLLAANGQPLDLPDSERPSTEGRDEDDAPATGDMRPTPDPLAGIA